MSAVGDRVRASPLATVVFLVYGVGLTVVGFWPEHVDEGAGRLVDLLLRDIPGLTYDSLEFAANVLLFVPFGLAGASIVKRAPAALMGVPVVALFSSALIETVQQTLLPGRTGSTADIIANTLGAVIGTVVVVAIRERYYRVTGRPRSYETFYARLAQGRARERDGAASVLAPMT